MGRTFNLIIHRKDAKGQSQRKEAQYFLSNPAFLCEIFASLRLCGGRFPRPQRTKRIYAHQWLTIRALA